MYTEGPWHLKLFFVVLIATSLVMFVVVVGYHMGYHWERAGVRTLVAVAVVTRWWRGIAAAAAGPARATPLCAGTHR